MRRCLLGFGSGSATSWHLRAHLQCARVVFLPLYASPRQDERDYRSRIGRYTDCRADATADCDSHPHADSNSGVADTHSHGGTDTGANADPGCVQSALKQPGVDANSNDVAHRDTVANAATSAKRLCVSVAIADWDESHTCVHANANANANAGTRATHNRNANTRTGISYANTDT
jgi:hypothetical protein